MSAQRPERFTILVIDDDELVREMVVELLEAEGHRVLSAASGEDGLATVRAVRPDLILVDHHMPGMTGHEVIQRLKADAATGRIPVVAMTSAGGEDMHKLSLVGAVAFIPKPFDATEFCRLIADILNVTAGKTRRTES
jgi:CheY-like chemotaxis protein